MAQTQFRLIKEFSDIDFTGENFDIYKRSYHLRKAARAIVLNDKGEIALIHASKNHYNKLPGGGIDPDESIKDALMREIMEETGATVVIEKKLGITIEYLNFPQEKNGEIQVSYYFIVKVKEIKGEPSFTEEEVEDGFEFFWEMPEKALKLMQEDKPIDYIGKFVRVRDMGALEYYINTENL